MPRYQYYCPDCEEEITIRHSMGEKVSECPLCSSDKIDRIMPYLNYHNNDDQKAAVGSVVKRSIEEARQSIKDEKRMTIKGYEK